MGLSNSEMSETVETCDSSERFYNISKCVPQKVISVASCDMRANEKAVEVSSLL